MQLQQQQQLHQHQHQHQQQTPTYDAWRVNELTDSVCCRCKSLSAREVEVAHELCCNECGAVLGPVFDQREKNRFDCETEADKSRHGMAEDPTLSSSANLSIRIGGGVNNSRGNGNGGGGYRGSWRKRSLQTTAVWSLAISAADRRQIQINKHVGEIATLMQLGLRIEKVAKRESIVERHATPGKAQRLSAKQMAAGAIFRACELLKCPRGVESVATAAEETARSVLRAARLIADGARNGFNGKPPTAAAADQPPSSTHGNEGVELLRCIGSINRVGQNDLHAPLVLIKSTLKLARLVWQRGILEGCMPHTVAAAAFKVASERSGAELGLAIRPQDNTKGISDAFGISTSTMRRAAKTIRDHVAPTPALAAGAAAAAAEGGGGGVAASVGAVAAAMPMAIKVEPEAAVFIKSEPVEPTTSRPPQQQPAPAPAPASGLASASGSVGLQHGRSRESFSKSNVRYYKTIPLAVPNASSPLALWSQSAPEATRQQDAVMADFSMFNEAFGDDV